MKTNQVAWGATALFLVAGLSAGCGDDSGTNPTEDLELTSSAFSHDGTIPARYTCDDQDISPPLQWSGGPNNVDSYVLIMDDPDAPGGTWVHWVVFNIPAAVSSSAEGGTPAGALTGSNSWGNNSYGGACPPDGTHRYYFKLYALDGTLNLNAGASKADVVAAMAGNILDQTELMARYTR